MYARSTTMRNVRSMDDGIAYVRDTVMPAVQGMSGCVGLSMMCDRPGSRCIVTTAWADESAMHASAESVREMRARAGEVFGGEAEVAEWEIALLHRRTEAPEGACTRVTWTRGDPATTDRSVDAVRMGVLPRLDELPGFCSVSLLTDRRTGAGALAATYASRADMEASAETVRGMREQITRELGMEITDMAEFDLLLAHLRVPETV
ncbi:hypothetical protein ACI792_11615 [Blastococcus sp. SYSU DS0669]